MPLAVASRDGRLVAGNEAFADFFDVPVDSIPGMALADLAAPDDGPEWDLEALIARRRGSLTGGASPVVGARAPVRVTPLAGVGGDDSALLVVVGGASEPRRRARAVPSGVFDRVTDGLLVLDRELRFLYANVSAERLLGFPLDEIIGRPAQEVFPAFAGSPFEKRYLQALEDGETAHLEAYFPPLDGWFEVHAYPGPDGLTVYFRNSTARRRSTRLREGQARALRAIASDAPLDDVFSALSTLVDSEPDGAASVFLSVDPSTARLRLSGAARVPPAIEGRLAAYDLPKLPRPGTTRDATQPIDAASAVLAGLDEREREGYVACRIYPFGGASDCAGALAVLRRHAEASTAAEAEEANAAIGLASLAVARKEGARALRESEERFRSLFEKAGVGMVLTSPNGTVIRANARFCEALGYAESEIQGRPIVEITHPDDRDLTEVAWARTLTGVHDFFELKKRYVRRDGSTFHARTTAVYVRAQPGEPRYCVALVQDMDERERAEARLRAAENRFRAVLENVADAITILDADDVIRYASPSVGAVLGSAPGDVVGKRFFELAEPAVHDRLRALFADVRSAPSEPGRIEFRLAGRDGSWRDIEAVAVSFQEDPDAAGIILTSRDISGRRALEREAAEQREAIARAEQLATLGTLVAGVAHEVNNPLTYLRGNLQLALASLANLPGSGADREAIERRLRLALRGSDRIASIVKSLRAVARPPGRSCEPVNVAALVRDLVDLVEPALPGGVSLRVELRDEPLLVDANSSDLMQMAFNLVQNGVDAVAQSGGSVKIRARSADGAVELSVSDDGPGIAAAVVPRLFDPFYTTKADGLGLGLPLVRAVAMAHGGDVHVASQPGAGTEFRVRLPASGLPAGPDALRIEGSPPK